MACTAGGRWSWCCELGPKLPAGYVAEPRVHLGAQAEIDVAAFDEAVPRSGFVGPEDAGSATAVWAPAEPTLAVETEMADFDEYEMRVYDVRHGRRLVAAVEIISPANKDRAENRHQFTAKCAALLRQGVSLGAGRSGHAAEFQPLLRAVAIDRRGRSGRERAAAGNLRRGLLLAARGKGRWLEAWNRSSGGRLTAAVPSALADRGPGNPPGPGSELRKNLSRTSHPVNVIRKSEEQEISVPFYSAPLLQSENRFARMSSVEFR